MNILLYARVSTDEQTLEPQWIELREYAARMKWAVVGEFSDVLSGAKAARPGLDAMLARCAAGGVGAVLVVKLDRLGRSVLNVVQLVEKLDAMKVGAVCVSQGIDTREGSSCGRMILGVMAAFAQFERDLIRERTRAGLRAARAAGKVVGRVSAVAPAGADARRAVVQAWRAETGGRGVRRLAEMLGGVSTGTAAKWAREYAQEMERRRGLAEDEMEVGT